MILLRPLFAFFELSAEESSPLSLATGAVLGMFIGMTPVLTLQMLLFILAVLLLRVNLIMVIVSAVFFGLLGISLDGLFDYLGLLFLTRVPTVRPLWAWMHHAPILPYTRFNNSIVLGSQIVCFGLSVPLFVLVYLLGSRYRSRVTQWFNDTPVARVWINSRLRRLYEQTLEQE